MLILPSGAPGAAPSPAPRPVRVPLILLPTGHVAVQVHLNGKGPYRLILDTGAPYSFINARTGLALGLLTEKASTAPAFFGMRGRTELKSVRLDGAEVRNMEAMLLDHPVVEALAGVAGPLEGILGMSFLGRFKATIDYQAGTLTLEPSTHEPGALFPNLFGNVFGTPERPVLAPMGLWGLVVERQGEEPGVTVTRVYAGSPAARGGLRPGDRILSIDGRWTDSVVETYTAAAGIPPGREVAIRLLREGEEVSLKLRPARGF